MATTEQKHEGKLSMIFDAMLVDEANLDLDGPTVREVCHQSARYVEEMRALGYSPQWIVRALKLAFDAHDKTGEGVD